MKGETRKEKDRDASDAPGRYVLNSRSILLAVFHLRNIIIADDGI